MYHGPKLSWMTGHLLLFCGYATLHLADKHIRWFNSYPSGEPGLADFTHDSASPYILLAPLQHVLRQEEDKARFPLPELTAQVDG